VIVALVAAAVLLLLIVVTVVVPAWREHRELRERARRPAVLESRDRRT
jgi:hypothetical protein